MRPLRHSQTGGQLLEPANYVNMDGWKICLYRHCTKPLPPGPRDNCDRRCWDREKRLRAKDRGSNRG
ncbi:hypothetical protein LCGC14_0724190 [marine sediment metagenome]|uniref:Uncharacterized protein n=1 Tax=marine sediment metagenome TaxID=412755 RepID=A0A0F9QWG7_9ZZZZ